MNRDGGPIGRVQVRQQQCVQRWSHPSTDSSIRTAVGHLDAVTTGAQTVLGLLAADAVVVVRVDLDALLVHARDRPTRCGSAARGNPSRPRP
jgi:hypothetical protein